MRFVLGIALRLTAGSLLSICLPAHAAEPAPNAVPVVSSRPSLPGVGAQNAQTPPPDLPGSKTVADTFRELLAMSPAARSQALATRTEHQRKYLEDSVAEYEALSPSDREARLQQLELRCYLPALMQLPPAARAKKLDAIPPYLRPLVEERLRQWDLLPPDVQKEAREYDTTVNYFLRVRPNVAPSKSAPRAPFTTAIAVPDDKRHRMLQRFFLELPPREQQKTIEALPAAEREDMEKTLEAFANLPPEERKACVDSFERLSLMSREQRNEFLKSAARWKSMSPRERETWRALVSILPPGNATNSPPSLPLGTAGLRTITASNPPPLPGN
jgi:hypothetical protein